MSTRTILITGAAGGLGSALAHAGAKAGMQLMLLDKNSRGLDRLSDEICEQGLMAPGLCPLDLAVAGPEAYLELAGILEQEFGGLHHLVHCAAHFDGLTPMDQLAPGEWMTSVQINLNAAWAITVACLPLLRAKSEASITFMLDNEARSHSAYWGAYGVSKAGLGSLARILAEELEASKVKVHAIDPGPMRTRLRASAYLAENPAEQADPHLAAERIIKLIMQD